MKQLFILGDILDVAADDEARARTETMIIGQSQMILLITVDIDVRLDPRHAIGRRV